MQSEPINVLTGSVLLIVVPWSKPAVQLFVAPESTWRTGINTAVCRNKTWRNYLGQSVQYFIRLKVSERLARPDSFIVLQP